MSANVLELNEGSFESTVLKSAKPVLVDFWAVWCGPCRQVAPIVESLAEKWGAKVTVVKLNVDDVPSVAEKYGIMSIPTLMLLSLIHISEPTRLGMISYAVFCLKK